MKIYNCFLNTMYLIILTFAFNSCCCDAIVYDFSKDNCECEENKDKPPCCCDEDTIQPPPLPSNLLQIEPVIQQTAVWCWVANGEMVFRYFGLPNVNPAGVYQCGIIGAYFGPGTSCWNYCFSCVVPAGSAAVVLDMLIRYPIVIRPFFQQNIPSINAYYEHRVLSKQEVKNEINSHRPIIAGISPSGYSGNTSAHVAMITGYSEENQNLYLYINDPFPFHVYPYNLTGNPYLRAGGYSYNNGRYRVPYGNFVSGLVWQESFFNIYSY